MATMPSNIVQEYVVPPGVTAISIEAETGGLGRHNSSRTHCRSGLAIPSASA
jgi:hypothetical protein